MNCSKRYAKTLLCLSLMLLFVWGSGGFPVHAQFPYTYGLPYTYGSPYLNQGLLGTATQYGYGFGSQMGQLGGISGTGFQVLPVNYLSNPYQMQTQTTEMVEGELIVNFSGDVQIDFVNGVPITNIQEINNLIGQYGISGMEQSGSGQSYIVKFSGGHNVSDVRNAFEALGDYIVSAEPNYVRKAHSQMPSMSMPTMSMYSPSMGYMGGYMGGYTNQYQAPSQFLFQQPSSLFGTQLTAGTPFYQSSLFPFSQGQTFGTIPSMQFSNVNLFQPYSSGLQQSGLSLPSFFTFPQLGGLNNYWMY